MHKAIVHSLPSLKMARLHRDAKTFYDEIKITSFLKRYAKGKHYYIYTHGCQANHRDSEHYAGILTKIGFKKTEDINQADLVLINTCAVRENAENKALGEIGNLKGFKAKKHLTLIVTGCMVMEEKLTNEILKTYPQVDILLGTDDIVHLPNALEEHLKTHNRIVEIHSDVFNIHERLPSLRASKFKAFVNITYGCDNFCTYCIVPYTRGRQRSRDMKDILAECKALVKAGYQEITLLGQNVDSYGLDLKRKIRFATLLDEVAKLDMPRLSFLTSHPHDFSLDIIKVMKRHKNIMPYLHLPVQAGDDRILKIMGRKYTSKEYLNIIKAVKTAMPKIAISTDIIVGFPNETEAQFRNTLKLVKAAKYDSAFTFIYSPRSGTPAAKMKDNVSYQDKVKRFKQLNELLKQQMSKNNESLINHVFPVLVDDVSKTNKTMLTGRLANNKIVNFKGNKKLVGQIVKVKINEEHIYFLMGSLVK
ncbi:MAG: tRNA (N6-isopentenyl adenosine(37)-C2)-methylthiotransferase MiaB [Bacilli bacterium]|nr:tRNA (N6-isopentenyl adenosine(37)-C2)-methylthiotransferase MiaB [Bacilli bacterium]